MGCRIKLAFEERERERVGLKFVEKASTAIAAAVNAAGKSQSEREEPEAK